MPAVDILGGLDNISQTISSGGYQSQYDVDGDIQALYSAAHDGHFAASLCTHTDFSFTRPFSLISLSDDGLALPKVYLLCKEVLYPCQNCCSLTFLSIADATDLFQ